MNLMDELLKKEEQLTKDLMHAKISLTMDQNKVDKIQEELTKTRQDLATMMSQIVRIVG